MIIPIKENGKEKLYKTDAELGAVTAAFLRADDISDMKSYLSNLGYEFEEYNSGLTLDFDKK